MYSDMMNSFSSTLEFERVNSDVTSNIIEVLNIEQITLYA